MRKTARGSCLFCIMLCLVTIACSIHFESGDVFNYSYETDLALNEADDQVKTGSHSPVGFKLVGDVRLSVVWKKTYDYLIKLEFIKSTLHSLSRENLSTDFKELRSYPIYFHWNGDGTVGRVFLAMEELTVSSNIKKGIISLLQMQTVDGLRSEVDSSGECDVEYSVEGNFVTKSKSKCKTLEQTGQYGHSNPMLDSELVSLSKTTYEFANNAIQSAEAVDIQVVFVTADKNIDMESKSRQTLKLVSKTQGAVKLSAADIDEAVQAADPKSKLDLIGMLLGTDVESPSCFSDCENLKELVESLKEDLSTEKVSTIESSRAFNKLLPVFRQASMDSITAVFRQYTDILPQLLDLAAAAQTSAALEAVMKTIEFQSDSDYQLAERFVIACSFVSHPREALLKSLLELHTSTLPSKELQDSVALSLGSVVFTFCRIQEQCATQVVADVEKSFFSGLESPEAVLRSVRALRNARLQSTKDRLIQLVETSKDHSVITAGIEALASTNAVFSSKNVLDAMSRIYHQTNRLYDSGARTSALSVLLKSLPSVAELRNIVLSTVNQTDRHISTCVQMMLQDIAASRPAFRERLVEAVNHIKLNNWNVNSPGGKANALTSYLGRTRYTDILYKLFMQNAQTGIMKKSGMEVLLQTSQLNSQPVLKFSLYAQGLESMIDSSAVPEGAEPEDPTAGLSLNIFDNLLRPVQFFKGSSELMSAVWNAPSEPVTALAINVLTHDRIQRIHLQNGIVLEHRLSGVTSIHLSGFIIISLWNQDAQSVIKNSGSTVLTGGLYTANNNYLSASLHFNKGAAAFIDFSSDVNFYVTPPQVCLRMSMDPFQVSEVWKKTEQARGLNKKVTHTLRRTESVPGASYLLSAENSRQCTKLLEK